MSSNDPALDIKLTPELVMSTTFSHEIICIVSKNEQVDAKNKTATLLTIWYTSGQNENTNEQIQ